MFIPWFVIPLERILIIIEEEEEEEVLIFIQQCGQLQIMLKLVKEIER